MLDKETAEDIEREKERIEAAKKIYEKQKGSSSKDTKSNAEGETLGAKPSAE